MPSQGSIGHYQPLSPVALNGSTDENLRPPNRGMAKPTAPKFAALRVFVLAHRGGSIDFIKYDRETLPLKYPGLLMAP